MEDELSDSQSNRELIRRHMKARRQPNNSSITNVPLFFVRNVKKCKSGDIRSILE